MKSALNFVLICLVTMALSCGDHTKVEETTVEKDYSGMASLDVKVSGMKCEFGCAKTIEKKVSEMAGVSGCFVQFEEGVAKVYYDDNTVSGEDIISFMADINEGSYEVSELENSEEKDSESEAQLEQNKSNVFAPGQSFRLPELITYFLRKI